MLSRILDSMSVENKMYLQYITKYIFRITRLLLIGIGITYFLACIWYLYCSSLYDPETDTDSFYLDVEKEPN